MGTVALILVIAAAVLAAYAVWKERAQTALGLAVLALAVGVALTVIPF